MKVPVYIISLASAAHRRTFQEAQAQSLGFEPIWSEAVGIQDISDAFFYQHAFQWQRALKKTEVACFMSHLQLWRIIASGTTPAVVLEDDVILGGNWFDDVQQLSMQAKADMICLEAWGKKILGVSQLIGPLQLRRLRLNSAGAAGYILWPSGARRLLSRYEHHGVALADAFINQTPYWSVWQLVPANVVQMSVANEYGLSAPVHGDSLIAREIHASAVAPNMSVICQMKWRRIKGELNKAWRRMAIPLFAKRDYVSYLSHLHR